MADNARTSGELLARIHTLVKKEGLAVNEDKKSIGDLVRRIDGKQAELQQLCQNTRTLWHLVDAVIHGQLKVEDWTADREHVEVQPHANGLGSLQFGYFALMELLKGDPAFLAHALANQSLAGKDKDVCAQAVVLGIYGTFFRPMDELAVLEVLRRVITLQLAECSQVKMFFRSSSMALKLLQTYCKSFTNAKQYLIAALRDPILAVLADDHLNLEIQPSKVYQSLAEEDKQKIGEVHSLADNDTLAGDPAMASMLSDLYKKLLYFCKLFIDSIESNIVALPFGIRWLAREVFSAAPDEMSEGGKHAMLGDFVFMRFINPAIVAPEPHGVLTDTPITSTARRNLTLIAKVLQAVSRGAAADLFREAYMAPLSERLCSVNLAPFFRELVSVPDIQECLMMPPDEDMHKGRRPLVVLSGVELVTLHTALRDVPATVTTPNAEMIRGVLKTMSVPHLDETIHTLTVGKPRDALVLHTEEEVVSRRTGKSEDSQEVGAAKSKLRRVLTSLEFGYPYRSMTITGILEREMQIALAFENRGMTAALEETLRALHALSPAFSKADYAPLLALMLDDYEKRQVYRQYLTKVKTDLLLVIDQMNNYIATTEKESLICLDYKKQMAIREILLEREPEFEKFEAQFKRLKTLDEKSSAVEGFLDEISRGLQSDALWRLFIEEEGSARNETLLILNKFFMMRVYEYAFFPNGSLDIEKDDAFEQIACALRSLPPEHPKLEIPKKCLMEAPWALAQKELRKMNAYKDPGDKLGVIVNTSKVIIELLSLSVSTPGADDLFPVLVYIVIQAELLHAESNIQYIDNFYRRDAMPAEHSYFFVQFCSAVAYVTSLSDTLEEGGSGG